MKASREQSHTTQLLHTSHTAQMDCSVPLEDSRVREVAIERRHFNNKKHWIESLGERKHKTRVKQ